MSAATITAAPRASFLGSERELMVALSILLALLVLYPIGWLVFGSFYSGSPLQAGSFTIDNYARAYGDPQLRATLFNTIVFAVGQTVVSVGVGGWFAWVVARTNVPGRRSFEFLLILVYLFPLILGVIAWTMLLSPGKGLLNQLLMAIFGLEEAPFDIYTLGGMIFVQGLYLAPLAFMMLAPAFGAVDSGLEEAARMSGSGPLGVFAKVTLPMVRPAALSAAMLMLILGIESFDVPQMLGAAKGIYTYPSLIYHAVAVRYPPDYGTGTALASGLLLLSMLLVIAYRRATAMATRFQTVGGGNYRTLPIDLGSWKWPVSAACWIFFILVIVLPVLVLVYGSLLRFFGRFTLKSLERLTLDNYINLFHDDFIVRSLLNSISLALVSALLCVALALGIAFVTLKTREPGRGAMEAVAMLPVAIPATVLGLGLLWAYVSVPLHIYGTVAILVIAYVTRYLPMTLRTVSGGMIQLGDELEEASRMSGASMGYTLRRVILPLLKPILVAAALVMFMAAIRELSMSLLLSGLGNPVVSVAIYNYYSAGDTGPLAALSVLVVVIVTVLITIARKFLNISFLRAEAH